MGSSAAGKAPVSEWYRYSESAFGLPLRLTNDATEAAVDLVLTVTLRASDGGLVEEREVSIPLLGPAEQATIVAVFSEDPRNMRVEVATLSYLR